jgi:starch-binding outer membrane protein, SusD/RagB family
MKMDASYRVRHFTAKALFVLSLAMVSQACEKMVDVGPPPTSLTSDNIYQSDATAIAVLTGHYAGLSGSEPLDLASARVISSIFLVSGLSADELSLYGGPANANAKLVQYYQNALLAGPSSTTINIWNHFYSAVYSANLAIEKLNLSTTLTPAVKKQLLGEAKFLRGFYYFYLVNLYGDVPLVTTSDYRVNSGLSRTSKSDIYNQIVADVKEAQTLLSDDYLAVDLKTNTTERVRPNKWVATALLARTYLYMKDWQKAEIQASALISNNSTYDTVPLNNVFLKNNREAIWQLQPISIGWNTGEARIFVLPSTGPNTSSAGYPVYLSSQLSAAFEANDKRKTNWIGKVTVGSGATGVNYYYPAKYKSATLNASITEYSVVFRLAEQYLIRAEARAHLGKLQEGLRDLNLVRHRAGLADVVTSDQNSLLNLIYHERQVELFTEWGHRWLDLKRTGKVDEVMSVVAPQKGTTWSPDWALYPIPVHEIIQDPNIVQNPGY